MSTPQVDSLNAASLHVTPSVLVAIAFGALLTMLWRRTSTAIVLVAAGAWLAYDLAVGIIADERICIYPVQCFLEPFRLAPVSSVVSVLAPAVAMLFGYRWLRGSLVA